MYAPEEVGDYALLFVDADGTEHRDIPAPLLDLAFARCGFTIASPADVGQIVSASMTVVQSGERWTQETTNPDELERLRRVLKGARRAQMGDCPMNAPLTLTMADGTTMTVHVATDSCAKLIFGGYACYQISKQDRDALWAVFDRLDRQWWTESD